MCYLQGMSLLHWACDRGHCKMVEQLLKKGASVNLQDDTDKQTPLHFGQLYWGFKYLFCHVGKLAQVCYITVSINSLIMMGI